MRWIDRIPNGLLVAVAIRLWRDALRRRLAQR